MKKQITRWLRLSDSLSHIFHEQMSEEMKAEMFKAIDFYSAQYLEMMEVSPQDKFSIVVAHQKNISKEMESVIADSESEGRPKTCKKGCSFCCNMLVEIGIHEAELLNEIAVEEKLEIDWDRLERQSKVEKTKYNQDLSVEDQKCVFLKDNLCSVYEYRPMACRKLVVFSDPQKCDVHSNLFDGKVARIVSVNAEMIEAGIANVIECGSMANLLIKTKKQNGKS